MNEDEADAGLSLRFVEQENARQELFQSVSLSAQDAEQMHANTIADRLFTQGALGAGGVASGLGIDLLKGIGGDGLQCHVGDLFAQESTNGAMQCSPRFGLAALSSHSLKPFLDAGKDGGDELFSGEVLVF